MSLSFVAWTVFGTPWNDNVRLPDGANWHLLAGDGDDLVYGGDWTDIVKGEDGNDTIFGNLGGDEIYGNAGNDDLYGGWGYDTLVGGSGNDLLMGHQGFDSLNGGAGQDTLQGGENRDTLTGGYSADIFRYASIEDSPGSYEHTSADLITDFTPGVDKIDLSRIDAISGRSGNNAFTFLGESDWRGGFGTVTYKHQDGETLVMVETDGWQGTDMEIRLSGTLTLSASDFIL